MHLKMLRFSGGLKLSNPLMGRREAVLHLFVEKITPKNLGHQVYSDRCSFHLFTPALTLLSLLKR
jgi:hypothetical protein